MQSDYLTLHKDDYVQDGWADTITGDPPRGSVPLIVVNANAVEQRATSLIQENVSASKKAGRI